MMCMIVRVYLKISKKNRTSQKRKLFSSYEIIHVYLVRKKEVNFSCPVCVKFV